MSWNGSMPPSRDSQSVTFIDLLSISPTREICFAPLTAIAMLLVATNFNAVWSIFMMSLSGMLCWRTLWRSFVKKLWSHFSPKRHGNYWPCWLPSILIPEPVARRFTSIERNLRSSTTSISNGWPLTLPTFDCTLVSSLFFSSCMDFLWLFAHKRTVLPVQFGNFSYNFLIATLTAQIAVYFAISCLTFLT